MTPAKICDKLGDIVEDVCQLRSAVGKTPDGLAAGLANLQDELSILHRDVARQVDGG